MTGEGARPLREEGPIWDSRPRRDVPRTGDHLPERIDSSSGVTTPITHSRGDRHRTPPRTGATNERTAPSVRRDRRRRRRVHYRIRPPSRTAHNRSPGPRRSNPRVAPLRTGVPARIPDARRRNPPRSDGRQRVVAEHLIQNHYFGSFAIHAKATLTSERAWGPRIMIRVPRSLLPGLKRSPNRATPQC